MKKLLLLIVIISLFSCKKEDPGLVPTLSELYPCKKCNEYYTRTYLDQYITTLGVVTAQYDDESDQWMIDSAHREAGRIPTTCFIKNRIVTYSLDALLDQLQADQSLTQDQRDDYTGVNNYFGLVSPIASPGSILIMDCP